MTYRDYFSRWGPRNEAYFAFDAGITAIARQIRTLPADEPVYLSPISDGHYTVAFVNYGRPALRSFDGRECVVLRDEARQPVTYFTVVREDTRSLPLLQRFWPQGRVEREFVDRAGQLYAAMYRVPAGARPVWAPAHPLAAAFGQRVQVLGFDVQPGEFPARPPLGLTLYMKALARMDTSFTVFVQLLGPQDEAGNALWGQHDSRPCGRRYPTTVWERDEIIVDQYRILFRRPLPAGDYRLIMGLYDLATMERLPLLDAGGNVGGGHVLLAELTVNGNDG